MFSVLVALWLLFGFDQGAEHNRATQPVELTDQKECSTIEEIGADQAKPRVENTSWGQIKRMYCHG